MWTTSVDLSEVIWLTTFATFLAKSLAFSWLALKATVHTRLVGGFLLAWCRFSYPILVNHINACLLTCPAYHCLQMYFDSFCSMTQFYSFLQSQICLLQHSFVETPLTYSKQNLVLNHIVSLFAKFTVQSFSLKVSDPMIHRLILKLIPLPKLIPFKNNVFLLVYNKNYTCSLLFPHCFCPLLQQR